MSLLAVSQSFSPEPTNPTYYDEELEFLTCTSTTLYVPSSHSSDTPNPTIFESCSKDMLISDIHSSPPPFEFDFLLSPNINESSKDEMSSNDQGSIKIEEVKEKEIGDGQEDEDVSMGTGMSSLPFYLFPCPSSMPSHPFTAIENGSWRQRRSRRSELTVDTPFQHLHINDSVHHYATGHTTTPVDMFQQGMYTPYQMGSYPTSQVASTPIHPYHFHPYNSNPRDCELPLVHVVCISTPSPLRDIAQH